MDNEETQTTATHICARLRLPERIFVHLERRVQLLEHKQIMLQPLLARLRRNPARLLELLLCHRRIQCAIAALLVLVRDRALVR